MHRKMLAEEALITWADGHGEPWTVPDELWENLSEMDADFQNAVMDLHRVYNERTALKALEIWQDACDQIEYIDETIKRDKALKIYKDHSRTIDALLSADPESDNMVLDAIKRNTEAYWCQKFRGRVESSNQGRLFGHFQALLSRLIHRCPNRC